jgi:phosphatidylserine/phosphatidylglycerophosphate/cardiolipin synthase-like enzyme
MTGARFFVDVATPSLLGLRAAVASGHVVVPPTRAALDALNLGDLAPLLARLDSLDREALLTVLDAVLAERRLSTSPRLDLLWTGPDSRVSTSRDTAVALRDLLGSATSDVFVAGFSFDSGDQILRPLHQAMVQRGVRVRVCLHMPRNETHLDEPRFVARVVKHFVDENWPFGPPLPELYYDPRTVTPDSLASMHAKCAVVDGKRALITSANFTDRGQHRNIEVGVIVDDESFARQLLGQWNGLVGEGLLRKTALR